MGVTNMTDHVSWGLYIANFTFSVGLAAGGVMMVIPAYLYDDHEMHDVVIIGELLAIAAIVMCLMFVVVDLGRPDRFWHMIPGHRALHWPVSMLTWDVIVLNGYLLINLHVCGYLLYMRYWGARPTRVVRALRLSLHRVGHLDPHGHGVPLRGLGGRPSGTTALLAPRFLAVGVRDGPRVHRADPAGSCRGGRGFVCPRRPCRCSCPS
jgi:hypothetical protein